MNRCPDPGTSVLYSKNQVPFSLIEKIFQSLVDELVKSRQKGIFAICKPINSISYRDGN
jgi:hypothetical protein